MTAPVIMLVAAEASGDVLGADLIEALRARLPEARYVGVGGPRMTAAGIASPFDVSELSIFGVFEALAAWPKVHRRIDELVALAERERPDVAVLIDSWGFTSRLAKALRKRLPRVTLVKYVGPQVWASRPGRAKTLARLFDHLLAILPFDAPFYDGLGVDVTFVGNPVMVREPRGDATRLREQIGAAQSDPILVVLPGSRPGEIARMMAPFEEAARLAKAACPDLHIVIPAAPTIAEAVKARVAAWPFRAHVVEGDEAKADAMKAATVALACSGTVTTEVALAGCPLIVAYKLSGASYAVARRLIRTPFITLLNIAAGREVAPELIQDAATGPALAKAIIERLENPALRAAQVAAQDEALKKMGRGGPDPSIKAADVIAGLAAPRGA